LRNDNAERFYIDGQGKGHPSPAPHPKTKTWPFTQKSGHTYPVTSRGSLYELETQIELAHELNYINKSDSARLLQAGNELSRVLNGLINSIS